MLKVIYRSETQQATKRLSEQNIKQPIMMLKTILNFSGVEVLSREELKNMNGSGPVQTVCTIPWTPFPYSGPCIMLPQDTPVLPLDPFPEEPLLKP
jgi:hypothetical protein